MLTSIQVTSRHRAILARLQDCGYISTDELARELNVSVHTIRRDLNILECQHQLRRCHGGAGELNTPSNVGNSYGYEQVRAIANIIVGELEIGGCLYVDSPSLGETLIGLLPEEACYLITPHIELIEPARSNPFIGIFFLGRDLSPGGDNVSIQMSMAKRLTRRVDYCIVEADYLDADGIAFDDCRQKVAVKRHFLANSQRQYVVCHHATMPTYPLVKIGAANHLRQRFILTDPTGNRINGERV
ncbi:TPA: DeoR family transcriptional regulator [Serratia fonticola]